MTAFPTLRTGRPRREHGHIAPVDGIEIPFGIVEGEEPGPCLLVTAGVHGSEFCSIEAALRLMRLEPEGLAGTLLVLPILNHEAFRQRSIYVMPQDGRNLNRMFPGRPDGTVSERLAHWLVTEVYPQADATIDMHGGDLSEALDPFSLYPAGNARAQALADAYGLAVAVEAGGEGYTINAAHRIGLPGIIVEVSGNGLWDEAGVGQLVDGAERVMHHLGMRRQARAAPVPSPRHMRMWVPAAPVDGLWYPALGLGQSVREGGTLGTIRDVFGTELASIRSERAGSVLYTLSSLSVNRGEALLGIGTPLET